MKIGISLALCAFQLFLAYSIFAQDTISRHFLKREDFEVRLIELDSLYKTHKSIPDELKPEILSALSFYPELSKSKIKFTYRRFFIRATMKAGPRSIFIFQRRKNRSYKIHINNNKGVFKGVDISKLSFNALVGLIGHELGHIKDYTEQSGFRLIWFGLRYTYSRKFMRATEYKTDMIAIEHGLGYGVYEFKDFMLKRPEISDKYKKKAKKYYMSCEEVLNAIGSGLNKN